VPLKIDWQPGSATCTEPLTANAASAHSSLRPCVNGGPIATGNKNAVGVVLDDVGDNRPARIRDVGGTPLAQASSKNEPETNPIGSANERTGQIAREEMSRFSISVNFPSNVTRSRVARWKVAAQNAIPEIA